MVSDNITSLFKNKTLEETIQLIVDLLPKATLTFLEITYNFFSGFHK